MTKLEQALHGRSLYEITGNVDDINTLLVNRAVLSEALALPVNDQIPMAWSNKEGTKFVNNAEKWKHKDCVVPLYTHPKPSAQWVGLTDEEKSAVIVEYNLSQQAMTMSAFARAIEAKLKEKNT